VLRCRCAIGRGGAAGAFATWIEASTRELAAPSVKQRLAALRHLFDWLVNGQVVRSIRRTRCAGPGML
jgi:site-specific recombinase XerC